MKKRIAALLPLCLFLSSCDALPYPRELESTLLVRVLGVDWQEPAAAVTAADDPEEGEEPTLLTASDEELEKAMDKLKKAGEAYVSLTHVTQMIVGEESDLKDVLEMALEHKELGQTATVWMARGRTAQTLMEEVQGGAKRLSSIQLNGDFAPPTVLEALAALEETGEVTLPRLTAKEGTLEAVDTVIWREDGDERGEDLRAAGGGAHRDRTAGTAGG